MEGIDYQEKYALVLVWSTVRLMMVLAASKGLATRQVDFSNAFVQAKLDKEIYIDAPKGYAGSNGKADVVLKLRKSLYGLVEAPLYWSNHLKAALENQQFVPSKNDPCLFIHKDMICLTYVDDCLFFGSSQEKIDSMIDALEADGLTLTREEDVFTFLGVHIVHYNNGDIELLQKELIKKVL